MTCHVADSRSPYSDCTTRHTPRHAKPGSTLGRKDECTRSAIRQRHIGRRARQIHTSSMSLALGTRRRGPKKMSKGVRTTSSTSEQRTTRSTVCTNPSYTELEKPEPIATNELETFPKFHRTSSSTNGGSPTSETEELDYDRDRSYIRTQQPEL